ncbi:MAG: hypothetical protein C4525_08615 [Desulfarculus sp.]|nr:MAG: hypothetical protein C4525_08615 [Desulfarculus sp.]
MKQFFYPESIAILGISPRPGNIGRNILSNLEFSGYKGDIYLVSPRGGEFHGRPIHPSVADLPLVPELAVVLTPAATVPGLVDQCGAKGIRRVIVETGGFSELGAQGAELERELAAAVKKYGLRMIGPNCIGVISTDSGVSVGFPLLNRAIPAGGLSIISQSGGIGLTYVAGAAESKVGLAKFISVGNKLDVNEADLLSYLIEDPQTRFIMMYLESVVQGRAMYDLIRSTDKPVVVHKSNIGELTHNIASSHTSALANDDAVVDAALKQAGAIRARTVFDAFQILKGLSLPKAKGRRLMIISRSGGHAVTAADAAFRWGLKLPQPPPEYIAPIQEATRASVIKLQNPLDLGDLFHMELYVEILRGALALEKVDAVVMVHGYRGPEAEPSRKLLVKVGQMCRESNKPVGLCLLVEPEEALKASQLTDLPIFPFADQAIMAISLAQWAGSVPKPQPPSCGGEMDLERCRRILAAHDQEGWLELPEALHLLLAAGLPVAAFAAALDPAEAARAAATMGWPVVLKAVGGGELLHKTEAGGVVLDLADPKAVEAAAQRMFRELGARRVVVMSQIGGGQEVILGAKQDPAFGPLLLFGLGGVAAEALRDVSLRLAPVDDREAGQMLDELRGAALLKGFRGRPAAKRPALLEAIMRVSLLVQRLPGIVELDINPLLAGPGGVMAVDARVRVAPGAFSPGH